MYIEGTKRNGKSNQGNQGYNQGKFVFADNSEVPSSALVWFYGEPNANEGCLSVFKTNFVHGDTTCSIFVFGFNFGFVCEKSHLRTTFHVMCINK